jgi:negative regulator of replication initiation
MRLTINLDDDLYAMARSHAIATKTSISKAVGDLLRRRTAAAPAPQTSSSYFDPVLGIQVSRSERPLTEEEIQRAMDDEDVRVMELMGLSSEAIEEALKR